MGWLTNVLIENKELKDERLEVADKESLYFLGPNLTVRNCTVFLKVPTRRLHILGARFIDCTFEVKQQLTNFQEWITASLQGCRFKGHFRGNDFGHWPEYGNEPEYQFGSLENCDFSEARLETCRFHGCDPRTLRFPRWPCFTFLEPLRHFAALQRVEWPGSFGDVVVKRLFKHPASTVALTYHAPYAAKFFKTTEEELKAAIARFDCFFY